MWNFPLPNIMWEGWEPGWYGSFGIKRKYDRHTGIDLYAQIGELVHAVENGTIVAIENFTGPEAESPWWLSTKAVLIEGESGVVLYGEIVPESALKVGDSITKLQILGNVARVIKKDRIFPSVSMLHLELYVHGTRTCTWWNSNEPQPKHLLNPTKYLLQSRKADSTEHYYNFLTKYPDICRDFLWTLYIAGENESLCNTVGSLSQLVPKNISDYAGMLAQSQEGWKGKFTNTIKWNKAFCRLLRVAKQNCPELLIECFNKVKFSNYLTQNDLWHLYFDSSNG